MSIYVYSTLTNDQHYGPWVQGPSDLPHKPKRVLIKGGSNRSPSDITLETPRGVVTKLTRDQLDLCMADAVFMAHMNAGYIIVDESEKQGDVDDVVENMEQRSPDAPETSETLKKPRSKKATVVNAEDE